jgi:hypothetical protein
MRCVGVELALEIDQDRATRREFLIGDCLLELRVSLADLGVERARIEAFAGHGKLVDENELKISQTFDLRIASRFTDRRSTAARNSNRRSAKEYVPNNEVLRGIWIHRGAGR